MKKRKDFFKASLVLHRKLGGKIEVRARQAVRTRDDLSLMYTPGVAAPARAIAENQALAQTLTIKRNMVAVITDGSAVLGLGNIGPEAALPVMEGKAVLFKELAGVDAFPLCLATNDTDEIIRIVRALAPTFGAINLEDIAAPQCFEIENRLRKESPIPVMHDDQWGTAVVVLAALINALKVRGTKPMNAKIVINGAGAAGNAVATIALWHGIKNIIVCDRKGIISRGRDGLSEHKKVLAENTNPGNVAGALVDALTGADVFIGVSSPNALHPKWIASMNPRPIIFALANPIPEIDPMLAARAGALIVATGRSDFPNQVNNALAFPGLFRGILDSGARAFSKEIFLAAANALARTIKNPQIERIVPSVLDKTVPAAIARAVARAHRNKARTAQL